MLLTSLELYSFRNYRALQVRFPHSRNIFVGQNGQGKTNLLESIYLTSFFKSFRTADIDHLISKGSPGFQIRAEFKQSQGRDRLEIRYEKRKKNIRFNGQKLVGQREHQRKCFCILFSNQDLSVISGGNSIRRGFFNELLGTISPTYRKTLIAYQRNLLQRNLAVRDGKDTGPWDPMLAREGSRIINARQTFLERIRKPFQEIHRRLLDQPSNQADIVYRLSEITVASDFRIESTEYHRKLKQNHKRDRQWGQVHFGPHRDDFLFTTNGVPTREYASYGQSKLFIYALKLAVCKYWARRYGTMPMLLLDDIFADLDEIRIGYFFKFLLTCRQVFITCANPALVKGHTGDYSLYNIREGSVHA